MSFLLPLRKAILQKHPNLTFHYYYGSGSDLLLRIRLREIDCAITSSRLVDPQLDAVRLHKEEYVFVGAPSLLDKSPLAGISRSSATGVTRPREGTGSGSRGCGAWARSTRCASWSSPARASRCCRCTRSGQT
jgi:DNA-binding transcriptional LysR family regulator